MALSDYLSSEKLFSINAEKKQFYHYKLKCYLGKISHMLDTEVAVM